MAPKDENNQIDYKYPGYPPPPSTVLKTIMLGKVLPNCYSV